jgi:hypothetical protein
MNNRRLLPLGLILLLAVLLAPVLRDFVREVVVIPFLYLFWFGRFIFESIPQAMLWGCFSILILMIMGISLLGKRHRKRTSLKSLEAHQERIESWANLIHRARQDDYFKWRLAQRLQKLTLDAIAHSKNQSLKQTRQQLKRGELDLPPELQAYFLASLASLGQLSAPKRFFLSKPTTSPLDLDPTQVIRFLENLDTETTKQIRRDK